MARSRALIAGGAVVATTAWVRHRRARAEAIALFPKKLVRARGLQRQRVERAADPRRTGVW